MGENEPVDTVADEGAERPDGLSDTLLTGAPLAAFLDRLEEDLDAAGPEGIDVGARLAARQCRADTLQSLFRLCVLWMEADAPERAQAVIDRDGESVADGVPVEERADTRMHLVMLAALISAVREDEAATVAGLQQASQIVTQAGPSLMWRSGGGPVEENAAGYREWAFLFYLTQWTLDTTLAVFDLRWALDVSDPGLALSRSANEALYHASRAQAFQRNGHLDAARDAARHAIRILSQATAPQVVDADDWLKVGDAVIELLPETYPDLAGPVEALSRGLPAALWREDQIRLTRLLARSRHAQGDLAGALSMRVTTTCCLDPYECGDDDFLEWDLPWLVEAGRYDEAGERVGGYLYLFAHLDTRAELIQAQIHPRLADERDQSAWWPLCVMRICAAGADRFEAFLGDPAALPARSAVHTRLFGVLSSEPDLAQALPAIFSAARLLAQERDPGNPWIDRFSLLVERDQGLIDDAQVMSRFEALLGRGVDDGMTWHHYLMARVRALGLPEALRIAPQMRSGTDAYRFSAVTAFGEQIRLEHEPLSLPDLIDGSPEEARHVTTILWQTMYRMTMEQGIARMEQFFTSGVGDRCDASPHVYSELCNNLSIAYTDEHRYDDAIALNIKGLHVSPFAQHYNSMLYAAQNQQATVSIWTSMTPESQTRFREFFVSTAQALWGYMEQEGYNGGDPDEWIRYTVMHLYYLGRHDEIPTWLERLVRWQEEAEEEDPGHLSAGALYARVMCVQYMANVPAQQLTAAGLVDSLRPQIEGSDDMKLFDITGNIYSSLGRDAEAVAYYERHLALNPRSDPDEVRWAEEAAKNLADSQAKVAGPTKRRRWPWHGPR
ncbi:MAG: tetratricopeptide repeat protein [Propionibacteriaceae bacterium]|nr:tetratricopeptide repeat protein [Propionibacteriaceae bacterium]